MAAEVEVDHCHEYPAHYKVMMDKLNEQRQLDQFTDITLIVDGQYTNIMLFFYFAPNSCTAIHLFSFAYFLCFSP